jgi:hypothetical protein
MRHFMRLNRYNISGEGPGGKGTDPLFPDAMSAIASRGDRVPPDQPLWCRPSVCGATDAKLTSNEMMATLRATAVSGPTSVATGEDQPVFAWEGRFENQTAFPHFGQPARFAFPWVEFAPSA